MSAELDRAGLWLDQAVGHHVTGDLDAAEASALTAKIKAYVGVTWILIHEAHNRRADKALGYKSWAEYVKAEFDMSRAYAYRLVAHAEAVYELAGAVGLTDVSPMGDISERTTRGHDIEAVAQEVERQSASLPADATDEDRAEVVRSTLAKQTTTTKTEVTFDPETAEVLPTGNTAPKAPETLEQRDQREAEQARHDRNVNFGKYLIGLWALLGDGEKPIDDLIDGWAPEECPAWLVEPTRFVFTPDGMRDLARTVEKLAAKWEAAGV